MEFVDIILIVMYLVLASSLIVVVWSKTRTWLKTAMVSSALAIGIAILVNFLPNIIESENNERLWNIVADVFVVIVTISLLATGSVVIWSLLRRK